MNEPFQHLKTKSLISKLLQNFSLADALSDFAQSWYDAIWLLIFN